MFLEIQQGAHQQGAISTKHAVGNCGLFYFSANMKWTTTALVQPWGKDVLQPALGRRRKGQAGCTGSGNRLTLKAPPPRDRLHPQCHATAYMSEEVLLFVTTTPFIYFPKFHI